MREPKFWRLLAQRKSALNGRGANKRPFGAEGGGEMRYLVIATLMLVATSALAGEMFDPGTSTTQVVTGPEPSPPAGTRQLSGPKEGETLPDGRVVGTPSGERPATQADIDALRKEWQDANRQASVAQRRGDGRSFARYRQRANTLAIQIMALSNRVEGLESRQKGMADYLHSQSFSNDMEDRGFITKGNADKLYVRVPKVQDPTVTPPAAPPVNDKPAPPAEGRSEMIPAWFFGVVAAGFLVLVAAVVTYVIWSRINQGIQIGRAGRSAAATAADPPTPEFTEAWLRANRLPEPEAPTRGRGWYSSGPGGSYAGGKFEWGEQPPRPTQPASAATLPAQPGHPGIGPVYFNNNMGPAGGSRRDGTRRPPQQEEAPPPPA